MAGNAQQQSRLKELIARGKEQGYLTYAEVNDHLPEDIADPEQVEDIISMINDMGIKVAEEAPDADTLMMSDSSTDESAAEEAVAALAAVELGPGRWCILSEESTPATPPEPASATPHPQRSRRPGPSSSPS